MLSVMPELKNVIIAEGSRALKGKPIIARLRNVLCDKRYQTQIRLAIQLGAESRLNNSVE